MANANAPAEKKPAPAVETKEQKAPEGTKIPELGKEVSVKTTGDFMLKNPYTGFEFEHDSKGDKVVVDQFIQTQIEQGQLEVV